MDCFNCDVEGATTGVEFGGMRGVCNIYVDCFPYGFPKLGGYGLLSNDDMFFQYWDEYEEQSVFVRLEYSKINEFNVTQHFKHIDL